MSAKQFKKRRTKLPRKNAIHRLLRLREEGYKLGEYHAQLSEPNNPLPRIIREVCLATLDNNKRGNVAYYPDLHNFLINDIPNRSIPVQKFLDMFRGMLPQETLDKLSFDLTAYRMEILTTPEDWVRIYQDDFNVHSCMSNDDKVKCYAHPENKLALAVLYPPGGRNLIARTIINTEEKWYVRLFGDNLLVNKLNEQGYTKLSKTIKEFKMYASPIRSVLPHGCSVPKDEIIFPYFDFSIANYQIVPNSYNRETHLVEVIINEGY